ncbi:MAG: hypothetical protein ABSH21_04350 [Verrucomicrobiia bacterium]|jgi:hypothetical protein
MKKNIWIVVLFAATAVLAAVVVRQKQQIARMKEQSVSAATETPAARAPVKETPEPPTETKAVEPVAAPPTSSVPTSAVQAGTSTGTASNFFAGLAGMMKNPQMKEMIRAQQKMTLDKSYGALFKYLDRPPDQLDALKSLLVERQMAMIDAGLSAMSGSGSDSKQAAEETKAIKAEYDQKIQDLLGTQDYKVFQDYEKTVGERVQVQMFKDTLPADAALTDQQEYDLIGAMYEARKALPASSLMNNQNSDPSQLTEERIAETLKQLEQLQQVYANRAAAILTPAQLEQFTKWQQQLSTMQAAGLKMAVQMFGNKGAPQPPAANQGPTP